MLLKWNEITVSQEFVIQNTRARRNIAEKNVQPTIEGPDGRVLTRLNQAKNKVHRQNFLNMLNFVDLRIPCLLSLLIMII